MRAQSLYREESETFIIQIEVPCYSNQIYVYKKSARIDNKDRNSLSQIYNAFFY